jgi:hypothetical protein
MLKVGGFDAVEQVGLQHLPPTISVTAYHERLAIALAHGRGKIAARRALLPQEQCTSWIEAAECYRVHEIYREGLLDGSVVLTKGQTLRMSKAGRQKLHEIGKAWWRILVIDKGATGSAAKIDRRPGAVRTVHE